MSSPAASDEMDTEQPKFKVELSDELNEWIWQDNMQFLQDKNIFEHGYFSFVMQMVSYVPSTLPRDSPGQQVPLMVSKLSCSFVLETLIHAKEKPTMLQWIEQVTKQFNSCHRACEWFLDHMAQDDWWPQQILIKCPNQVVRQMFHRLLIHVITQLQPLHSVMYLHTDRDDDCTDPTKVGNASCVTRFIKRMLAIVNNGSPRPHCKYLSEYFAFLYDFAKMGDAEAQFLLRVNAVSTMVHFFLAHKSLDNFVEILSDEDEEESVLAVADDKYWPQSLEKMIHLVAHLVEKSRMPDNSLGLSEKDTTALLGGKGYPFLFSQIKDYINIRQTCNLIFSLSRWNERVAVALIEMIFAAISRLGAESQPFFKILSLLVEFVGGPPGMPQFTQYILHKFWDVAEYCPQQSLDWLSIQVMRNKLAHTWTLRNLHLWVESFLITHSNPRVRQAAAVLLVSLVPSNHFRQAYRQPRSLITPCKEKDMMMSDEALMVLRNIYSHLLTLLAKAKAYTIDVQTHGTAKLVAYFTVMTYCLISRHEKIMFTRHFPDLWNIFQPKLSEPAIAQHNNKQALLHFWHTVCIDCPENVKLIVGNHHVAKNIAFNYILADHEDQEVVLFNRTMLPSYYGILYLACKSSRTFMRQLAAHQNLQWAFKNITPYPNHYPQAVEELMRIMRLMITVTPDMSVDELRIIKKFKRETLYLYITGMEARTCWQTLITVLRLLLEDVDDKIQVLELGGLRSLQIAFNTVYAMHHEATACHVTEELYHLLHIVQSILLAVRIKFIDKKVGAELKAHAQQWKEKQDFISKLLTLLSSYQPPDLRQATFDVLHELVQTYPSECIHIIAPNLVQCHTHFQDSSLQIAVGPYFPKRGEKIHSHKVTMRQCRPQFHMFLQCNMLECTRGVDEAYDHALDDFFHPYHTFIDLLMRVSINQSIVNEKVIKLNVMVACEGIPLHEHLFAKLWGEIWQTENLDRRYLNILTSSQMLVEYIDSLMLDERSSLNITYIYQFFALFFPKYAEQVLQDNGDSLWENILQSLSLNRHELERPSSSMSERNIEKTLYRLNGDMKALLLILRSQRQTPSELIQQLAYLNHVCREQLRRRAAAREKVREEIERRERLMRERRERERKATSGAEEVTPQHDTETGEDEMPKKRRKKSDERSPDKTSACDSNTDTISTPHSTSDTKPSSSPAADQSHTVQSEMDTDEAAKVTSATAQVTTSSIPTKEKKSDQTESGESRPSESSDASKSETDSGKVDSQASGSRNSVVSPSVVEAAPVPSTSRASSSSTSSSCSSSSSNDKPAGVKDKKVTKKDTAPKQKRAVLKEKPTLLDQVTRHIENVFGLLNPSTSSTTTTTK